MGTAIALTWLFLSITTPVFAADSDGTKNPEPEGYRVVSYDAATHQWVILRNGTFDGKYMTKRITVVCYSILEGPDTCHLQVGNIIIPNRVTERLSSVDRSDELLIITNGYDAHEQYFKILKYEVLPDK